MRILQKIALTCLLGTILLFSCSDQGSQNLEEPGFYDSLPVPDTTLRFDASSFEEIVQQRASQGDTIPRSYAQLQQILPDSFPGFKPYIEDGGTFQTRDFAFSEATRVYYDTDENYIEINAADYVADPDFFASVLQRHQLAQGLEVEGVIESRLEVADPKAFAWQSWNPDKKIARVYMGYDFRFFLTLEQTGAEDLTLLKGIWRDLDWQYLK